MDGKSQTPQAERLNRLSELLPEAFTEGKIDWEKLQITLGQDLSFSNERYMLNWAGKSDAFRVMQEPSSSTLVPDEEESVNFEETENIFIEGENLEVLKLLQKSYFGKVKMIYIDPPYNTGSDSFIYPDKFSETKDEYLKRIGDKDAEGYLTREGLFRKNVKENGQFHSNWLNMMYPRLFLAKNLLKKDGLIFVSIDDNEYHNLRLLMNEVFGEENFIESIIWKNKYGAGAKTKGFISNHEYILCYSKSSLENIEGPLGEGQLKAHNKKDEKFEIRGPYRTQPVQTKSLGDRPNLVYPIVVDGNEVWPEKQWVWSKERMLKAIENNDVEIEKRKDGSYSVRSKQYLKDENGNLRKGKPLSIMEGPFTQEGTAELRELFGKDIFSFPKPSALVRYFYNLTINEREDDEAIFLDFFAGSCPTAQAILDLNVTSPKTKRKFICVQLPEPCEEDSSAFKAGYSTIAEIGRDRIRKVFSKIEQEHPSFDGDLGFKVFRLEESNFKQWRQTTLDSPEKLFDQITLFVDPIVDGARVEDIVFELLLKTGKDLNSRIKHIENLFVIDDGDLILLLEEVNPDTVDRILKHKPEKVIALDRLFMDNDQLKTNTALQMKDAGIEFKTV